MTKRFLLPVCALFLLLAASCSEDFEVSAPYKQVTVVFGLLDMGDTAHYIRIQKAFLDESKSALDMAKVPDSSFYQSLDVQLRDMNGSQIVSTTPMTRVDLNLEGYTKADGTFFDSPNRAYKTKQTLVAGHSYRLIIQNTATGNVDSAETPVISNDTSVFRVESWFMNNDYSISFNNATPTAKYSVLVKSPDNAAYMEGIIRFRWANVNTTTGQQTDDSADFNFSSIEVKEANVRLEALHSSFYPFLRAAMGDAPAGTERRIDSCAVFIYAATDEFYRYLQYSHSQGGITADQIQPIYTNIRGANTVGLFAGRTLNVRWQVPINISTLDSLMSRSDMQAQVIHGRTDH